MGRRGKESISADIQDFDLKRPEIASAKTGAARAREGGFPEGTGQSSVFQAPYPVFQNHRVIHAPWTKAFGLGEGSAVLSLFKRRPYGGSQDLDFLLQDFPKRRISDSRIRRWN